MDFGGRPDISRGQAEAESLQAAFEAALAQLDTTYVFPEMKKAALCQAACCDTCRNRETVQRCYQTCGRRVETMQAVIGQHLNEFQERLSRCLMRCQDRAKESLPVSPNERQVAKAQEVVAACSSACAVDYERKLPKLKQDVEAHIKGL